MLKYLHTMYIECTTASCLNVNTVSEMQQNRTVKLYAIDTMGNDLMSFET